MIRNLRNLRICLAQLRARNEYIFVAVHGNIIYPDSLKIRIRPLPTGAEAILLPA